MGAVVKRVNCKVIFNIFFAPFLHVNQLLKERMSFTLSYELGTPVSTEDFQYYIVALLLFPKEVYYWDYYFQNPSENPDS